MADWIGRAERLLEAALYTLRSDGDPLPLMGAAEMALRVGYGEVPEGAMDGYQFPGEDNEDDQDGCTCPPGLKERGGFTSTCPRCAPGAGRG